MHRPKEKGYKCIFFSVLISHLYVKFGERIIELTTQ